MNRMASSSFDGNTYYYKNIRLCAQKVKFLTSTNPFKNHRWMLFFRYN